MAANVFKINYKALPTLRLFHLSNDKVRAILGPVGSGKSSGCIIEGPLLRAMKQEPAPDGVRRTRGAIIRNTYPELITTTIKSFRDWYGTSIATYRDKPLSATIKYPMQDGTRVECEVLFLALDKPEDVGKIRSLELTWGYINEASEIQSYDILDALRERIGRYPKQWGTDERPEGGCTWSGIWLDSNAPDDEHWIYRKFEVEKPTGFRIFHQPPAVLLQDGSTPENPIWVPNKGQNPNIWPAENIDHLGKAGEGWNYYLDMLPGKDYDKVRVMLCGEYGTIAYGRPVYPEYKDQVYYYPNRGREVELLGGIPLLIGVDFGFKYAAAVFAQLSPMRQLRVLEEFVAQDISTREFAAHLLAKLRNDYRGMTFVCRGDPAGLQHGRTDARTDIDIMNDVGIPTEPCLTNSPKERLEAVKWFMHQLVEGEPGLVIGSKCQQIRKGFAGRYYYKKISTSGRDELYHADPVKNEFSHPHDALQYIAASLLIDSNTRNAAMRSTGSGFGSIYAEQTQQVVSRAIDAGCIY